MNVRTLRLSAGLATALMLMASVSACAGASSCAPSMLTIRIGFSSRESGSCAGVYGYLGVTRMKVGGSLTADIPRSRELGALRLPESSDPAVVSVISRSANGHHEKLRAIAKGTATLIIRTPLCPPEHFVATPSPRFVGSQAVAGPCRILRIVVS
jgi:hypothetical protein